MRRFRFRRFASFHTWPRAWFGGALGIFCALAVQIFVLLGWLDGLDRGALDTLFRMRGANYGSPDIILVIANDQTSARYNAWPLPRGVYAQLVERLKKYGSKTIAFDLLFSEASASAADDAALIRVCRQAGNVIQAGAFHVENRYNPSLPVAATGLDKNFDKRFELQGSTGRVPSAVWVSAALPELRRSAPLLGHLNVHPRDDGTLRRIPHIISYRGKIYPSLSLAAAAHFLGVTARDIQVDTQSIEFANRVLPLGSDGETGINWAGGAGTFPTYPITQVLDGQVPPEVFRNRIVLIGTTAAGSYEYRATPFSGAQPAIEVQANALDNILKKRPLVFATPLEALCLLLIFAGISGALIAPRLDFGGTLSLLGLGIVLWLTALWLLATQNFYLPIAPPLTAAFMTYALAMALNYRREWEENFRTEAAAIALARGGALLAEGRHRTRLHNVVCDTARDALCAQSVFLATTENPDPLLRAIAERLTATQNAVLLPARRNSDFSTEADPELLSQLEQLARRAMTNRSTNTLIAAPLPRGPEESHPSGPRVLKTQAHGALIAVGSRERRVFSSKDCVLLKTLAEQAALAFENLEYYELLQSRVELANRDLRDAYGVLAEQSAKFMAAVESIDDALIICDASGNTIFVNQSAPGILREATPALGESAPEVLRANGLDTIAALFDCLTLNHTATDNDEPARCEMFIENAENSNQPVRTLSAGLTPLATENQRLIGAMLLVADISAQRELDQMKTDFVAFVAHELRSPLGAILGYASLLQEYGDQTDTKTRNEMTSSIVRQCHRLNRLIGDLLDISRLDAGQKLDLRREKVELRSLVEKVLDAQSAALSNPRITLKLECAHAGLSVWGDADRLEQILVNLVSNAVKYSPDGGEVTVTLSEDSPGQGVLIQVSDNGIGMSADQISNLFQKFYRASDVRTRGIKGTGLGLFLVKNLVEAHNGKVEVQSISGKGTTFSIRLPQRSGELPLVNDEEIDESSSPPPLLFAR